MSLQMQLCFLFLIKLLCRVDGNVKLEQKISSTKSEDKTVVIDCHFPSGRLSYIHWYQLKEGQTLRRILYSSISSGSTYNDAGFESFKVDKKQEHLALKIPVLKKEHSAVYYCSRWISDSNADKVVPPILTGYLPSKKTSGKQTMLCQATKMFPDLVKFTWQKKSNTENWIEVPVDNIVEQRNGNAKLVTVTSMMIVDKPPAEDDLYKCTVAHEGGTGKYIELKKDNKESAKKPPKAILNTTCPPKTEEILTGQISERREKNIVTLWAQYTLHAVQKFLIDTSEQMRRLYVFVYAYGVMLMKNGVYFCVVSIFLLKRKFGKKESS